jgi:hypothetical protein
MAGKAMLTAVSSWAVAVPSPIMTICQNLEVSRPAATLRGSGSIVDGT